MAYTLLYVSFLQLATAERVIDKAWKIKKLELEAFLRRSSSKTAKKTRCSAENQFFFVKLMQKEKRKKGTRTFVFQTTSSLQIASKIQKLIGKQ